MSRVSAESSVSPSAANVRATPGSHLRTDRRPCGHCGGREWFTRPSTGVVCGTCGAPADPDTAREERP